MHSSTGLAIIGKLLLNAKTDEVFKRFGMSFKSPYSPFSDRDIILPFLGLACCGTPYFEAVDFYKNDRLFTKTLDLNELVSKACLRQRMGSLALKNEELWPSLDAINFKLLKKYARPLPIENTDLIPINFDVTVMDNTGSNKERVEQSYRPGIYGYTPMMTNIGRQGYLLNHQFRKGASHSNCKDSLEYIITLMNLVRSLYPKQKLLARIDSDNDADANVVALSDFSNSYFVIKHQQRGRNTDRSKALLTEEVMNNYSTKPIKQGNAVYYNWEKESMACIVDEKGNQVIKSCRKILCVVELPHDLNTELLC